ncbi:hypothetical protein [uncultured Dialister sp.]|uniref:hypothetical protein n=1 Tax=uncultured Dialister sp. TaxID=278064 RepID=UPI0026DBED52|nr:hypothetical protein [uncultured Dialister sp.]
MMKSRILKDDDIRAVDHNNTDGEYGFTAVPVEWPDNLTGSQKMALAYWEDAAAVFKYMGRYVITDGSGSLTVWGDGSEEKPFEDPLAVLDTEEEVRDFLDDTYREAREDGIILPFPDDEEEEE